ncbi:MAG: hypothetical protein HY553_20975 [Elusimicrobia bacterium]|nr:hypothetical protein [Elusimicrobiota bacterium]
MMRVLLQFLALYLGGVPACAQTVGATHLLTRGPGAEAAALGNTVLPTVADPSALYWNPAGLANAGGMVMGEHLFLYDGARYDFIGLSIPSRFGSFGFGALQLDRGNIIARNAIDDPGTKVSNTQSDYLLGFARRIGEHVSAGGTANLLHFNLAGYRDIGIGLDLGGQASYPADDLGALKQPLWSVGAVLKNLLPPGIKLKDEEETLPREYRAGLSLDFKTASRASMNSGVIRSDRAGISLSVRKVSGEPAVYPGLGVSYTWENLLVLRAGYDGGLSGGFGLRTGDGKFVLDYALENKPLSKNHRFTVSYRFKAPNARPARVHEEIDDDYAKAVARARALSEEHFLRGRAYFKDLKYWESLEPLRLASALDSESREKRDLYQRAVEVARREKLRRLSQDMDAGMAPGEEALGFLALARMLTLKPTNRLELLERLRRLSPRMAEAGLDAASAALLEELGPAALRFSSLGLSSEALRLIESLEACVSSRTVPGLAELRRQVEEEAQALRSRLDAKAQDAAAAGQAYRALIALQRAFPEDPRLAKRVEAARAGAASRVALDLKERLYLRRLYFLAAIQYANRNPEGARDLLEEILRRDPTDRDATALEDAMVRAGAEEDQLQ